MYVHVVAGVSNQINFPHWPMNCNCPTTLVVVQVRCLKSEGGGGQQSKPHAQLKDSHGGGGSGGCGRGGC